MTIRGKSLKMLVKDISEGYTVVNPLFLKPFDQETFKKLYHEVAKAQSEVRGEKFPYNDINAIRWRNTRLQRLYTSQMIIRNFARDLRISLV